MDTLEFFKMRNKTKGNSQTTPAKEISTGTGSNKKFSIRRFREQPLIIQNQPFRRFFVQTRTVPLEDLLLHFCDIFPRKADIRAD